MRLLSSLLLFHLVFGTGTLLAQSSIDQPGIVPDGEATTFEQHLAKVNASTAFFDALRKRRDNGPTINLNLLRYRPQKDNTRYSLYGAVASKEIMRLGGDILAYGNVTPETADWDAVAFALFPEASSYLRLQESSNYQEAIPDRVAGTYERMLYLLSDGDQIFSSAPTIKSYLKTSTRFPACDDSVIVLRLIRFAAPESKANWTHAASRIETRLTDVGAKVVLSAAAELPIISRHHWDHVVAFQFPTLDAAIAIKTDRELWNPNGEKEASFDIVFSPAALPAKQADSDARSAEPSDEPKSR